MKQHSRWLSCCTALIILIGPSCAPRPQTVAVPSEVLDKAFVYDVVRHLYRWYMDELDVARRPREAELVLWVRALSPVLDPGDRSRFAELVLPAFRIVVELKQADYTIQELGINVRNETFKIVRVSRAPLSRRPPPGYTVLKLNYADMRDELFRTRRKGLFPDGRLLERMRAAVRQELERDTAGHAFEQPVGEQVVHFAPLSPVANEAWVFWETGRLLIHFASDIDLAQPEVWEHDELAVHLYNIDEQVVVSLDEAAGSNAYLTRDQVGRALYNCIILGQRLVIEPRGAAR